MTLTTLSASTNAAWIRAHSQGERRPGRWRRRPGRARRTARGAGGRTRSRAGTAPTPRRPRASRPSRRSGSAPRSRPRRGPRARRAVERGERHHRAAQPAAAGAERAGERADEDRPQRQRRPPTPWPSARPAIASPARCSQTTPSMKRWRVRQTSGGSVCPRGSTVARPRIAPATRAESEPRSREALVTAGGGISELQVRNGTGTRPSGYRQCADAALAAFGCETAQRRLRSWEASTMLKRLWRWNHRQLLHPWRVRGVGAEAGAGGQLSSRAWEDDPRRTAGLSAAATGLDPGVVAGCTAG